MQRAKKEEKKKKEEEDNKTEELLAYYKGRIGADVNETAWRASAWFGSNPAWPPVLHMPPYMVLMRRKLRPGALNTPRGSGQMLSDSCRDPPA